MELGKKYRPHNGSINWLCEALTSDGYYVLTSPHNVPIMLNSTFGQPNQWIEVKEPRKTSIYYIGIYEDSKGKLYVSNINCLYKANVKQDYGFGTKLKDIAEFQYIEPV